MNKLILLILVSILSVSIVCSSGEGQINWLKNQQDSGTGRYYPRVDVLAAIEDLQETSFVISLNQGWNLISIPLILNDNSVASVFSGISYSKLFYYDTEWKVPTKINTSFGYWIKVNNVDTLTVVGREWEDPVINYNPGWNLLGYPHLNEKNVSVPTEVNISIAYAYNGSWLSYVPYRSFNSLIILKPGYGYWINKK